ncbi:hypothetical protein Tco_0849472 [Tanacetum coccineum]
MENKNVGEGGELNKSRELFIKRNPQLKVNVVDESSLAVAVVLYNISKGTTQVVIRGDFNKVSYYLALALCQKGIQVAISKTELMGYVDDLEMPMYCGGRGGSVGSNSGVGERKVEFMGGIKGGSFAKRSMVARDGLGGDGFAVDSGRSSSKLRKD